MSTEFVMEMRRLANAMNRRYYIEGFKQLGFSGEDILRLRELSLEELEDAYEGALISYETCKLAGKWCQMEITFEEYKTAYANVISRVDALDLRIKGRVVKGRVVKGRVVKVDWQKEGF